MQLETYLANKRTVLKFYKGGFNSKDIEELPWYEWHEVVRDLAEHIKKQEAENKKGGSSGSGGDTYNQAKQMMKGATPNFKMPSAPKLK